MFIFFKRNDNCIFLGIIPSFKLMVFSFRQTICFQQQLNFIISSRTFLSIEKHIQYIFIVFIRSVFDFCFTNILYI